MSNPKVSIGQNKFGNCVVATIDIKNDEVIAEFGGDIFEVEKASDLPESVRDHAIQFEEHKWRDGVPARYINHSCEPNAGIKGLFTVVAMRDIQVGEEVVWDYDMTEDSDWRMDCLCGTPSCRKIIGAFSLLSQETRDKYKGYVSNWLVKKYNLEA